MCVWSEYLISLFAGVIVEQSDGRNQFVEAIEGSNRLCSLELIPDVFKHPLCFFLIGPLGAAPLPPSAQRASNHMQSSPELWATWASCLQVWAGASPGTVRCCSCDWRRVRWRQISGQRSESGTYPKTTRHLGRWGSEQRRPGEERRRTFCFLVRSSSDEVWRVDDQSGASLQDRWALLHVLLLLLSTWMENKSNRKIFIDLPQTLNI